MISEPERGEVEPRILIVAEDVDAARDLASLTRLSGCRTAVAFGATMATSTSARGVMVPNRMLKPCANRSSLPAARFGSIAS